LGPQVQGAVTVLYAAVLRCYLPASLELAPFLSDDDRRWLREQKRAAAGRGAAAASGEVELGHRDAKAADEADKDDDSRLLLGSSQQRGHASSSAPAHAHGLSAAPEQAGDPEPLPLTAMQQVAATARNLKVWYLIAIKVLKVRRTGVGGRRASCMARVLCVVRIWC
jgi:hypothetical protein